LAFTDFSLGKLISGLYLFLRKILRGVAKKMQKSDAGGLTTNYPPTSGSRLTTAWQARISRIEEEPKDTNYTNCHKFQKA
jgi:hypothetical protein